MRKIGQFLKRWWWVLLILFVIGGIWWGRGRKTEVVSVGKVETRTVERTISASGKLAAPLANQVLAPLAGVVETVAVEDGQTVTKGTTLFTYKSATLLTALKQAEVTLLTAQQARQAVVEANLTPTKITSLQAAMDGARAARDRANAAYEANKTDTNKATLEAAVTAHEQSLAVYEAAINGQPKELDLNKAQAAVTAAETALAEARHHYNQRVVTAPADGLVALTRGLDGANILSPDKLLTQGLAVASVVPPTALLFVAEIDQADLPSMTVGQAVTVELDPFSGEKFNGRTRLLPSQPSLNSSNANVYLVEVTVEKLPAGVRIGMEGQAAFILETAQAVTAIPAAAITVQDDQDVTFIVRNGQVERRTLKLGVESADWAQVASGVTAGDQVVISDNLRDLKDQQPVTVK